MAKTKQQKKAILSDLHDKINQAKSVIFASFSDLPVKDNEILRKELKTEDSEYYVIKKTLLDLSFKDLKIKDLDIKGFSGQVAIVFGYGDEVAPARIINKFNQGNQEKIKFIGGILGLSTKKENKFIDGEEVTVLAKLPSQLELYAKIVGSVSAPISGLVNALGSNLRNLVYTLKAIEK
jgi:large subunit ribosomal protein L10